MCTTTSAADTAHGCTPYKSTRQYTTHCSSIAHSAPSSPRPFDMRYNFNAVRLLETVGFRQQQQQQLSPLVGAHTVVQELQVLCTKAVHGRGDDEGKHRSRGWNVDGAGEWGYDRPKVEHGCTVRFTNYRNGTVCLFERLTALPAQMFVTVLPRRHEKVDDGHNFKYHDLKMKYQLDTDALRATGQSFYNF